MFTHFLGLGYRHYKTIPASELQEVITLNAIFKTISLFLFKTKLLRCDNLHVLPLQHQHSCFNWPKVFFAFRMSNHSTGLSLFIPKRYAAMALNR